MPHDSAASAGRTLPRGGPPRSSARVSVVRAGITAEAVGCVRTAARMVCRSEANTTWPARSKLTEPRADESLHGYAGRNARCGPVLSVDGERRAARGRGGMRSTTQPKTAIAPRVPSREHAAHPVGQRDGRRSCAAGTSFATTSISSKPSVRFECACRGATGKVFLPIRSGRSWPESFHWLLNATNRGGGPQAAPPRSCRPHRSTRDRRRTRRMRNPCS
jgi:hypothetical protein